MKRVALLAAALACCLATVDRANAADVTAVSAAKKQKIAVPPEPKPRLRAKRKRGGDLRNSPSGATTVPRTRAAP